MEPYSEELCRRLLLRVRTPGLPYRWLANPYRGAPHPCAYCLGTGRHELRGHAGLAEFEARTVVKPNAPAVLRSELAALQEPGVLGLGAAYDPYGPAELRYRLTQQALEIALAAGQPVCVVTNSALVLRDAGLLGDLAVGPGVQVVVTLSSFDEATWRHLEPEASTPAGRLTAIERLHQAGVPVGVALAPIIPDFNDSEDKLAALASAAASAGARFLQPPLLRVDHGSVEWALPGIRMLHPHLPAAYQRRYRGPLRPERYTHDLAAIVDGLRTAHGLAEGVVMQREAARGQLALM